MARARSLDNGVNEGDVRGAAIAAPRSTTPLKLVEAAVAGDDLQSVARAAAAALSCTVAIALPALGLSAQWPANGTGTAPEALAAVHHYAAALVADREQPAPPELHDVVPVRLGHEVVGIVAALAPEATTGDARPWLDATAAAAAVAALMRDSAGSDLDHARRAFLQMLELPTRADPETLLTQARRLGYDFSQGLLAVGAVLEQLGEAGVPAIASSARRGGDAMQDALQEAAVLLELLIDGAAMLKAHEETYRLLVGVLVRNPDELLQLRRSTIASLEEYDSGHDTELLGTLETFLAHHGSTTDTAEAMALHRHTVGYRLARVQEVSGLSPYESEGRERLSLGLKAHRIMGAESRRLERIAVA
jgi:hypothetical protein